MLPYPLVVVGKFLDAQTLGFFFFKKKIRTGKLCAVSPYTEWLHVREKEIQVQLSMALHHTHLLYDKRPHCF